MTNTSSPRTFSRISTKISLSEKRRMLARTSGKASLAEMASASGLLLLPVRIFMAKPLISNEKRPPPAAMRAEHISRPGYCKRAEISRLFRLRCGPRVGIRLGGQTGGSDRGHVIDHDDAMEPPDIGLLVPFARPVQGATIVRHQ